MRVQKKLLKVRFNRGADVLGKPLKKIDRQRSELNAIQKKKKSIELGANRVKTIIWMGHRWYKLYYWKTWL